MSEDLVIGIDFGTTNCCISIFQNDKIDVITNPDGGRTTPSYLFIENEETFIVGKYAKSRAENAPKNGIYELKRLVGRKFDDPYLQNLLKYLPYEVTNDEFNDPIVIIEQIPPPKKIKKRIVELCSLLFKNLKQFFERQYGSDIKNVVVTVPAYFKVKQRQAILQAATEAKFSVLKLLNEPTAAALCHFFDKIDDISDSGYSVVYDLGGGTFDVAVLKKPLNNIEIISVDGDSQLGGHDFDNRIKDYVCDKVMADYKYDLRKDKLNMVRLHELCENAKKALSTLEDFKINLPGFVEGCRIITIELTRQKFEELTNDLFEKTIHIVDECLKNCKINKEQIKEVILSGGSTRIPKIQKMISEYFKGKLISKLINPDECVAQGAALQAAMLSKHPRQKIQKFNLIDVIPLSIGIADFVGRMEFLIQRNTPIPYKIAKSFVTTYHQQPKVELKVYEGERLDVRKNRCIATLEISDITLAPAGACEITVEMKVDGNGILTITAKEELKKIEKELKVTYTRGDKSEFEIRELVTDAEKMKIQDEEFAKVAEARAYLIEYCDAVIRNLKKRNIAEGHALVVKQCERLRFETSTNISNSSLSYIEKIINQAHQTCDHVVLRYKFENMPKKKF